jgi:hypothetical protein
VTERELLAQRAMFLLAIESADSETLALLRRCIDDIERELHELRESQRKEKP